ncbi:MAG: tetratricopeptide repeat protein [Spirochaetaceae bacterium]|jgi:tetratricopeptide (TPR) repeat protein|nr:tetratricopeptide repeat protein [Spirochaetaceae bacterium]
MTDVNNGARLHKNTAIFLGLTIAALMALFFIFAAVHYAAETKRDSEPPAYYICGTKAQKETLRELWHLLENGKHSETERFALVREIAKEYQKQNQNAVLINFLSEWTLKNPDDRYNGFYLLMIANIYMEEESQEIAGLYFNSIVRNYPDLMIKGASIHLECLKQLINLIDDPKEKIWYYEELLARFPGSIDLGVAWFMLGQTYEQTGEWDNALAAYTQFMPFYGTVIPGFPDAYAYAKQMVDFSHSSKNWTFESLPALLATFKNALDNGNTWQLWQYRAKVNFFSRSWAQSGSDDSGMTEFNLPYFSSGTRINYAKDLSPGSNANEAYFRTWGWPQFTSVWYFYFRKVNFPLDSEIHGRWEWAGVYYGERF